MHISQDFLQRVKLAADGIPVRLFVLGPGIPDGHIGIDIHPLAGLLDTDVNPHEGYSFPMIAGIFVILELLDSSLRRQA